MRQKLSELRVFIREFRQNFHSTGAIAPSSRYLARALARYVSGDGRRILEVGPGTGAVTQQIIRRLGPSDELDLVELNDSFIEVLRKRFRTEAAFQAVADRCRVIHQPVEELPAGTGYDAIVSGLPLNNFAVDDVARILAAFAKLAKPGGTLSFFEYIAVRPMRSLVSGSKERQRLRGIGRQLGQLLRHGAFRRECVLCNLPPAWVHHVRFAEPPPAGSADPTKPGSNSTP